MNQPIEIGTKRCPFCAEEILAPAILCRFCGNKMPVAEAPIPTGPPPVSSVSLPATRGAEVYRADPSTLSPDERAAYSRHSFETTFSVPVAVVLSILTINFFFVINYSLKHGKMPKIARNDPSGAMALVLLLLPFFNFYWVFFMWTRLVDRINYQFKLRGQKPPLSKWLPITLIITFLLSAFGGQEYGPAIWLVVWLVWAPMFTGKLQSAINRLAITD